jgi:hypothetical protein
MFNLVELCADEQYQSPCKYGNIVARHACYCHNDDPDTPRKCNIWRSFGEDKSHWNTSNCRLFDASSPQPSVHEVKPNDK